MKTTLYTALLMLIVSVSACKKDSYKCKLTCDECEYQGAAVTICAEDFGDNDTYETAVVLYEDAGYDCTRSTVDTETTTSDDERRDLEDEGYVCNAE